VNTTAPSLRHITPPASLLLVAAAGAWVGVVVVAQHMGPMPGTMGLGIGTFVVVWVLMMTAMMLPSVTPFASIYTRTFSGHRAVRTVAFAAGYLIVWGFAAVPAYALAWFADRLIGTHPSGATALAVVIFATCGVYQVTPLKDRCLAHCRSPIGFTFKLGSYQGRTRDLRAGVYHGAFCLACCWGLMALLIAFGLMNLVAMLLLAAVVVGEKVLPWGSGFSRALGVAALILAVVVVFDPGMAPGLHPAVTVAHMGSM
jgi:predicted metal-binding membrane protein